MKKRISLMLVFVVLFCSCASVDVRTLMQASSESITPKLHHIAFSEIESSNVVSVKQANAIDVNSYFYTLLKRELPNFIEQKGKERGNIALAITYVSDKETGIGWTALSLLTLGSLNLLGMPGGTLTTNLEFEVNIYDEQKNKIWSRIYNKTKTIYVGLYYNFYFEKNSTYKEIVDKMMLEMFRSGIADLKNDLAKDVVSINQELISN